MLKDLDAETLYDVIQNVSEYVLTGEKHDCDNTLSRVVCNQLINVIDRKGQKSHNSSKNLPDRSNKEKKEVAVSTNLPKEDIQPLKIIYTEDEEREYLNSFEKPTPEECVEILQGIKTEKGDYAMTREANMMGNKYGYPVKDLCIAARGY